MIEVQVETEIQSLDAAFWDAMDHGGSPFLEHGFLRALEESGSIGPGSGWHPFYLVARDDGTPLGAVCAFLKTHSYGEYIFDWGWADASERAGIPYYPKLVIAAPVTPATGPRILLAKGADPDRTTAALAEAVRQLAEQTECYSIHWLFCTQAESERLEGLGFWPRASFQFHWHNPGYESFDDFLGALTSRKRKQIRKERRRSREGLDAVRYLSGAELSPEQIVCMDRFYRSTVKAHWGGRDYLRPGFFEKLVEYAPERVRFAVAERGDCSVAGALFLETEKALYGRYWGCDEHHDLLHFEIAYYLGIERCIEAGLPLFEAGAQGEHKLLRGFAPSRTYSAHWLRHPDLARAIRPYLAREAREVELRMRHLAEVGPYKKEP